VTVLLIAFVIVSLLSIFQFRAELSR